MGLLSKLWKGVKKTVKKIAKGVKKVFKKIGSAVGKLGIVGQIGMMFLMPYAMGALSSFAGSALGTVGQWSANLLSQSGIGAKALGHGLNMIHKAGTFAGKLYTTVSDTIGNAFDRVGNFAKGDGFVLSEGRTSIFAKGNERSIFSTKGYELPKANIPTVPTATIPETAAKPDIEIKMPEMDTSNIDIVDGKAVIKDTTSIMKDGKINPDFEFNTKIKNIEGVDSGNLFADLQNKFEIDKQLTERLKIPTPSAGDFLETNLADTKPESLLSKTFGDINIFDKDSAIRQDIADFNVYDDVVKPQGEQAVMGRVKQDFGKAVGIEQPEYEGDTYISVPDIISSSYGSTSKYREVDLMNSQMGNSWMTNNYQNVGHINNLFGFGKQDPEYNNFMNNFGYAISNEDRPATYAV